MEMPPKETWLYLPHECRSAACNMAWDEALLESVPRIGRPVLRFYGWTEQAASFGYFQRFADVECLTPLRPLVRRPTGGGLVPHDRDWTYALVFPAVHPWHRCRARESYARVHEWIQRALKLLALETELARGDRTGHTGQCFVDAVRCDVLWQGRKVAGAAQRRTRQGLLIQGSVQPPSAALQRADWETAMREAARSGWGVQWELLTPEPWLIECAQRLASGKYSQAAYNERR
jgi:lipoate-protein ligase A